LIKKISKEIWTDNYIYNLMKQMLSRIRYSFKLGRLEQLSTRWTKFYFGSGPTETRDKEPIDIRIVTSLTSS